MKLRLLFLTVLLLPAYALAAASSPVLLNFSDLHDWTAAQLGHDRLIQSGGEANALLVVTGGAFDGAAASEQRTAADAALIDAAGFDVVNLAHRDLRGNAAALVDMIGKAKAKFISATFELPQGQTTPWKAMAVIEKGGRKIAFIGLADQSASMQLPGSGVMAGLRFTPPQAALKQIMPQAERAADTIVILADAPVAQAAQWIKTYPKISAVIVSGRGGGGVDVPGQPKLFRAPPGGEAMGIVSVGGSAKAIPLRAPDAPSAAFGGAAKTFGLTPAPLEPMKPAQTAQPSSALTSLQEGKINPTTIEGQNRAAVLSVSSLSLVKEYGGIKAPAGRRLLVVQTHWRNILTPQIIRDKKVPVVYKIPKLSDHLYCVADGARILPAAQTAGGPGLLSWGELSLPQMGATADGRLLFDVSAQSPPKRIVLRFYDFAHGPITLPLVIPPGQAVAANPPKPDRPLQKNDLLEMGVYQFHKTDQLNGQAAPAGMTFVTFDLRARSLFTTMADATAYDPKAKPGQKIALGTVADWKDARRYQQLLADGQYAYGPLDASTLSPLPRFLPDLMTGGQLAFLVPAKATSLELLCGFPNAALPDGTVVHPKPLRFVLEGSPPSAPPAEKPIASVKDDVFDVAVVSQRRTPELVGQKAGDGKVFLTLDMQVQNNGQKGEFFQPDKQLKYAAQDGSQSPPDAITKQLPHPPIHPLWIPPGEARTFEVAYRIAANQTKPRLAYGGVSRAKVLDLQAIQGASPAPAQAAAPKQSAPAAPPPSLAKTAIAQKPPAPPAPVQSAQPGKPALPTVPVHPALQPKGLAGVGLTPEQVNAAIDRGRAFLWNYIKTHDLKDKGRHLGDDAEHSLAMLALVHAGTQKKYPDFDAALRSYLARVKPEEIGGSQTYRAGLLCMTIDGYGDTSFLPQLRRTARYLVEAQGPNGTWNYDVSIDEKIFADPNAGKVLQVNGGTPLNDKGAAVEPWKRLTPWTKGGDGDNSNTQYALLGLASAMRGEIKLPPELWKRALEAQRKGQSTDGGWGYNGGDRAYGSMTTAGICAIALCRNALGEKNPEIDPQIEQGLAWLSKHFSVNQNPASGSWNYYYLYSVERVGRILNTEFIGDHEWYPLGAQYLVGEQKPDGSWVGKGQEADPRLATGFALLFLTRATPSMQVQLQRGGNGTLKTGVIASTQKLYIILDASGSMLDAMGGKSKFDIARDAVAAIIKDLPDSAQVALRVYGGKKRAIEKDADADSVLEIPMGKLDKPAFLAKLKTLRARGKTPLALSLRQAKTDLGNVAGDKEPVTVLLLTDGGEDTLPRQNPVKAAAEFGQLQNVRLQIVGFNINRDDWSKQLAAMTQAAHGVYWPVARADALEEDVRAAVLGTPRNFTVLDQAGKQVAAAPFGQSVSLPEGQYRFVTQFAGRPFSSDLWINTNKMTTILFNGENASKAPAPPAASAPPAVPATSAARFCTHCGAPLPPGAKFCPKCGAKVP
jgi:hypothetical protein